MENGTKAIIEALESQFPGGAWKKYVRIRPEECINESPIDDNSVIKIEINDCVLID